MKDERIRLSLLRCQLVSHVSSKASEMSKVLHLMYTRLIDDHWLLTSYVYTYSTHCLAVPHGIQLLPIITKRQTPGQLHTAKQSKMTCKLLKKDSADPQIMFIPFRPKTIKTTLMTKATASKVTPNPIRMRSDRVSLAAPSLENEFHGDILGGFASISPMLAYCVVEFPFALLALTPTRQYCAESDVGNWWSRHHCYKNPRIQLPLPQYHQSWPPG